MIELVAPPHVATLDSAPYWEACDEGRLLLPHCGACEVGAFFPPRLHCPACGARPVEWVESPGLGTLYSSTTVHFAPFAQEMTVPYTVCQVDLDEGVRMLSRYVGEAEPRIGAPVAVAFATIAGTDQRAPVFLPREEGR